MKKPDPRQPLDYASGYTSPYDKPVKYPKAKVRRRGPSKLRMIYWVVMLTLIAAALWYLRKQLGLWEDLVNPKR